MAFFKCKMCGGELEINEGQAICTCDFCGTKQTLPRLNSDIKQNLYDRASHLRRNNEYDKAENIYEKILNEDTTDAEAYWSLVLCRYGIEYVDDPITHNRIPTINRTQYTSIFADENYKMAIKYASFEQKQLYEQEAFNIDSIQKGILAISEKSEPFDVFICYKETDENGRRTPDSVFANDIYHQLTEEGYKVFFAKITLEDKLGQEYEPYIFAALNSAKVMIVLGTKPEYFNAVWVKNEWSRFLALIRNGEKKILIPAYKDMDPYDLPEEFSMLQAQDMSKLGFMQDVIRGINKIINKDSQITNTEKIIIQNNNASGSLALIKRGRMALEDREWQAANNFFEEALNVNPECGEAYLGKLLSKNKCADICALVEYYNNKFSTIERKNLEAVPAANQKINEIVEKYTIANYLDEQEIRDCFNFTRNYDSELEFWRKYKNTIKFEISSEKLLLRANDFADDATKKELEEFYNKINKALDDRVYEAERNDSNSIEKIQSNYIFFLTETENTIQKKWEEQHSYKEADYNKIKEEISSAKKEDEYLVIASKIDKLGDYHDAFSLKEKCIKTAEKIKNETISKRKRIIRISLVAVFLIYVMIAGYDITIKIIIPNRIYTRAQELQKKGEYEAAVAEYKKLDSDFKDSKEQINFCEDSIKKDIYIKGKELIKEKKYEEAIKEFEKIEGYRDSKKQQNEAKYLEGIELAEEKKYDEAISLLKDIDGYKDSNEKIYELEYLYAGNLIDEGDYAEAFNILTNLKQSGLSYVDISDIRVEMKRCSNDSILNAKIGDKVVYEGFIWSVISEKDSELLLISEDAWQAKNGTKFYSSKIKCFQKTYPDQVYPGGKLSNNDYGFFILSKEELELYLPDKSNRKNKDSHAYYCRHETGSQYVDVVQPDGTIENVDICSEDLKEVYYRAACWLDVSKYRE